MSLVELIHIAAFSKCAAEPRPANFRSIFQVGDPFAPSDAYAEFWLERLAQRRLVSQVGADPTGLLLRLSPQETAPSSQRRWISTADKSIPSSYPDLRQRLLERPQTTVEQISVLTSLWRDLAVAEAQTHLATNLIHLRFEPGLADVAAPNFATLSESLSIAEMFYVSWLISRDFVASVPRRPDNDKVVLENYLRTAADTRTRSSLSRRALRPFERLARLPESSVAWIFARVATDLNEHYLTVCPSEDALAAAVA